MNRDQIHEVERMRIQNLRNHKENLISKMLTSLGDTEQTGEIIEGLESLYRSLAIGDIQPSIFQAKLDQAQSILGIEM